MQTYRTFIAIELPIEIRRRIKEHIDQLRSAFPAVRASWSREDNLHLTLKFLGDISISRIPELSEACSEATKELAPFALSVKGCGTFPPHGKPKVLWIGIEDAGTSSAPSQTLASRVGRPLQSLHAAIEHGCASAGFGRESRPYHPHLTIARLREARDSRTLAEHHQQIGFSPLEFTVSELTVFRSELNSQGSKHTALARHALALPITPHSTRLMATPGRSNGEGIH